MQRFLGFDEMVTPTIITILYWLGIALIIIGVLSSLFQGFWAFIIGLIGGAIGLIFWRVWCEILLVLFKMNDHLVEVARNTRPPAGSAASHPAL